MTRVDDPPPSRFMAFTAPRSFIRPAASYKLALKLNGKDNYVVKNEFNC
jgi:hypothetical protein